MTRSPATGLARSIRIVGDRSEQHILRRLPIGPALAGTAVLIDSSNPIFRKKCETTSVGRLVIFQVNKLTMVFIPNERGTTYTAFPINIKIDYMDHTAANIIYAAT
jgi:hypothetical protein